MIKGILIPWCIDCDTDAWMQAVAALGAVIMPHNLYLHSALVKTRKINRKNEAAVSQANKYFLVEGAIAIFISFLISTLVIGVFANGLYGTTYGQAYNACLAEDSPFADVFDVPEDEMDDEIDADLYNGGVYLGCAFGIACTYIWAVGILASGQSSTMTGTYSGQFAMEGFLNIRWKRWQRVLLTRSIAMVPTFCVAFYSDIDDLTGLNDILNACMSILLPFAIVPALTFSSNRLLMGRFATGPFMRYFCAVVSLAIVGINVFFTVEYVKEELPQEWWVYAGVGKIFWKTGRLGMVCAYYL